ncbi:hypothetical protein GCM10010211_28840 [Streptomyces albospinus]|uniref:Uncharacterized protein n=1 Tax=Streptomyces albospinus TaxID=285515 RepID=A0ABQ2V0B0_9ACTN|nr:hypothetical protein [Streptomyces albospinus]GGU62046.1 hypothetical protein GCM10010211_28840 [Streptomyces albospinus]
MTVRAAWLLPTGQTREDTRLAPLGTYLPESAMTSRDGVIAGGNPLNATGVAAMQVQVATDRALVQGKCVAGRRRAALRVRLQDERLQLRRRQVHHLVVGGRRRHV